MSEAQSGRPSALRGRGSARGGRGGYSSRGGRGGPRHAKSDNQENIPPPSFEDEGEIGELKKKHGSKITTVKELFPDWTDEDIVFALESTDGDLEATIERITEGMLLPCATNKNHELQLTNARERLSMGRSQEENRSIPFQSQGLFVCAQ